MAVAFLKQKKLRLSTQVRVKVKMCIKQCQQFLPENPGFLRHTQFNKIRVSTRHWHTILNYQQDTQILSKDSRNRMLAISN